MDWSKVNCPANGRIFRIHTFTFMLGGHTYHIEVDEFANGQFTGHAEDSIDKSSVIESVNGATLEKCLSLLLEKINDRQSDNS